jgi:predicted O-linked N-acetylglucosamine transferase (SPINDLY family)
VAIHPKLETWWRRASELLAQGEPARAVPHLEKLIKAAPQEPAFRFNLSACLLQLGKPDDALVHLKRARQLGLADSTADPLLDHIALRLRAENRIDDALVLHRDLAERHPEDTMRLVRLSDLLREAGRFGEALDVLQRIDTSDRHAASVFNGLGLTYQNIGLLDEARASFARALGADPASSATHKNIRYLTLNTPGLGADETFSIYRDLAQRGLPSQVHDIQFARDDASGRPLRIGYISSDFRLHVVGFNILPLIEHHDPASVELYFYSDVAQEDPITARFRARAKGWRSIVGKSDADAAALVRADKIDIAVFLAGSFDGNRTQLAAHRVAPVQVSYHDCATSGFDAMDYFIADPFLTPIETQERFSEEIVRLPVFYQYERRPAGESFAEPPCVKSGVVTFGSFNKPEKINADVIALWARVLNAVPDGRLLLKYFNSYRSAEVQRRIADGLARHGINAARLIFKSGFDASGHHLALYDSIDIALDTFPFTGATTTFEALSRGVPVVTLWGDRYVARYAGAIASHAGFAEFACADHDSYVAKARQLADNPGRLTELKRTMPGQLAASPLCDGAAYARTFEAAYRDMWTCYLARVS